MNNFGYQIVLSISLLCAYPLYAQNHSHESHEMSMSPTMNMSNKHMTMHGMLGRYPMSRESSGTSWQPQSTPMIGYMFMTDTTMNMVQGFVNLIYDHQGGRRGEDQNFSTSMLMFMSERDVAAGTFGYHAMFSLDPAMGKGGYPLLLQTGETANGRTPLIDRQHPHDFFMELATIYSLPITEKQSAYIYLGLPGEPALGPPDFMMRFSAIPNPEAPITHHWLDSTHITYGVITIGYIFNNIKIEGSLFKGREPDQYRWNIEPPKFDSQSVRLSYNPGANWALQLSYGWLKSPEQLEPNVNTNRATASIIYNKQFGGVNNWQTILAWGQDANHPGHTLNGYLLESALNLHLVHTLFGRIERVQKDELFIAPSPCADNVFMVNKFTLGYLYEMPFWGHAKPGLGALISTYALPQSLHKAYGSNPISYMLFGRISIA